MKKQIIQISDDNRQVPKVDFHIPSRQELASNLQQLQAFSPLLHNDMVRVSESFFKAYECLRIANRNYPFDKVLVRGFVAVCESLNRLYNQLAVTSDNELHGK